MYYNRVDATYYFLETKTYETPMYILFIYASNTSYIPVILTPTFPTWVK